MASVVTLKDRREIPLLYLRLLQRIEALEGRINGLWRTDLTWARMTADAPVRELFAVTTSDCPSQADMVGVAPAPSPPITMRADGAAVQMILDACPHSSSHATFEARARARSTGLSLARFRHALSCQPTGVVVHALGLCDQVGHLQARFAVQGRRHGGESARERERERRARSNARRGSPSFIPRAQIHHPDLEAAEGGARALTERLLSLLEIPCDACTQHVAETRDEAQQYIAAFRECALVGA